MKTVESTRFGIGTKLIIGLGTLIGISIIVGTLAILGLVSIQGTSKDLSDQFLPETLITNEIERQTLQAMYNVRGYWLSTEQQYYQAAGKNFQDLDKALAEAKILSEGASKLAKLREELPKSIEAKTTYVELLEKKNQGCHRRYPDGQGRCLHHWHPICRGSPRLP